MALTTNTTDETRFIFVLQNEDGEKTERTLATPYALEGATPSSDFVTKFTAFRNSLLNNTTAMEQVLHKFIQPANWRDNTGSTGAAATDPPVPPWETVDLQVEFYTVTKKRYTVE